MQINNLENRKINKTEGWFFEKINKKLIKTLARLLKQQRKRFKLQIAYKLLLLECFPGAGELTQPKCLPP